MALRFAVQADSQRECAQGLDELCARLGLQPVMLPKQVASDRWLARAVPTTKTPTDGRGPSASG